MTIDALDAIAIAYDEPFRMEIENPATGVVIRDKDGNPAYIDLISPDDPRCEDFKRRIFERAKKSKKDLDMTYDEVKERSAEMFAEYTVGWYLVGLDGSPIDFPFSKENARKLYGDPKNRFEWIREQVAEAVNEDRNFFKVSSKG